MIKIKLLSTGEIKNVTPNEAFDLIDRGLATRADDNRLDYSNKQLRPQKGKGYKIK